MHGGSWRINSRWIGEENQNMSPLNWGRVSHFPSSYSLGWTQSSLTPASGPKGTDNENSRSPLVLLWRMGKELLMLRKWGNTPLLNFFYSIVLQPRNIPAVGASIWGSHAPKIPINSKHCRWKYKMITATLKSSLAVSHEKYILTIYSNNLRYLS